MRRFFSSIYRALGFDGILLICAVSAVLSLGYVIHKSGEAKARHECEMAQAKINTKVVRIVDETNGKIAASGLKALERSGEIRSDSREEVKNAELKIERAKARATPPGELDDTAGLILAAWSDGIDGVRAQAPTGIGSLGFSEGNRAGPSVRAVPAPREAPDARQAAPAGRPLRA